MKTLLVFICLVVAVGCSKNHKESASYHNWDDVIYGTPIPAPWDTVPEWSVYIDKGMWNIFAIDTIGWTGKINWSGYVGFGKEHRRDWKPSLRYHATPKMVSSVWSKGPWPDDTLEIWIDND